MENSEIGRGGGVLGSGKWCGVGCGAGMVG